MMRALDWFKSGLDHEVGGRWIVAGLAVLAAAGMAVRPLGADFAYHIAMAGRLAEGAVPYDDIATSLSPLALYLGLPPVLAARWTGLAEVPLFQGYLALLGLASLWLTNRALAAAAMMPRVVRRLVVLVLAFHLFLFEPLAITLGHYGFLVFFLPYLATAYLLIDAPRPIFRESALQPWGDRLAVTLLLGLALVLNPPFILAFLVVEATVCATRRNLASLARVENALLIVILALAAYLMERIYGGMVSAAYAGALEAAANWDRYIYTLLFDPRLVQVLAGMIVLVLLLRAFDRPLPGRGLALMAAIAALALVEFDLQQLTAYAKVSLPAVVLANLALAAALAAIWRGPPKAPASLSAAAVPAVGDARDDTSDAPDADAATPFALSRPWLWSLAITLAAVSYFGGTAWTYIHDPLNDKGRHSPWRQALEATLTERAAAEPAFAFASHGEIAFPAIVLAGARYPYRHRDLSPLAGFYESESLQQGIAYYRPPAAQGPEERAFFTALVGELLATPPLIVAVETTVHKQGFGLLSFDFIDYFSADPRFGELWRSYELVERVGPIEIYRLVPERAANL
jgi:hypothetical protein